MAVREWDDEIVFLHKIIEGATDRSYGIQVARLAGVPQELVDRAKTVLAELETGNEDGPSSLPAPVAIVDTPAPNQQLGLFDTNPNLLLRKLGELEPEAMTPLEALIQLQELKAML